MEELIFEGIEAVMRILIAVGVIFVIRWLSARFTEDEMNLIKEIVMDGVMYAQQVWGHLDGPERYPRALEKISEELKKRGINVSDERLKMFIESAVKMLKAELGENWPAASDEKER